MRPINSCIGSPTYSVAKYLAKILKPLECRSTNTVNNSKEFSDFVSTQVIEHDETVVSFDVVSLFTSIPIQLAIEVVQANLDQDNSWRQHTGLEKHHVMDLLKFVLDNSFSVYQGVYYHQTFGCSMGPPVSAVLAELVMIDIETRALSTFASQPRWWKRYVDDSNTCLKRTDVVNFHSHLNSINSHIQFTIEYPDVTTGTQNIAFLDCKISAQPERTVQVSTSKNNAYQQVFGFQFT